MSEHLKGHIVSEEQRIKISKANKGHKHTEEYKQRMSEIKKKVKYLGIKVKLEFIQKKLEEK